jgi:hypothetical protein
MRRTCLFSDETNCLKIQQSIEEIFQDCAAICAYAQASLNGLPDAMDFLRYRLKTHVATAQEAIKACKLTEARLCHAEIILIKYQIEMVLLDTKKDPEDFAEFPKKTIQIHMQGQIHRTQTMILQMKRAVELERKNNEYLPATEFERKIEISSARDHEIQTFMQTLLRLLDDDSIIGKPLFFGEMKLKIAGIEDNYKKFNHLRSLYNNNQYSIATKPFFADFILASAEVKTFFHILSDLAPENLLDKTRQISELHQTLQNKKPIEAIQRPSP